jgi:hypothetical protein
LYLQYIQRIFVVHFLLNVLVDLQDRENDLLVLEVYEKKNNIMDNIQFTGFLNLYFHFEFLLNDQLWFVFVLIKLQQFFVIHQPMKIRNQFLFVFKKKSMSTNTFL